MSDKDDEIQQQLDMMNPDRVNRDNFLEKIAQIESSGGKNTNHKTLQSGIHAGEAAVGQYGLMPNTLDELLNRQHLEGRGPASNPEMQATDLSSLVANDPKMEHQFADQLARKVLNQYPNQDMAAYAWNHGHNLTPKEVENRDYENDPYVQKFQAIKKSLGY